MDSFKYFWNPKNLILIKKSLKVGKLDDFGLKALYSSQQITLLEIIEDRHYNVSNIISSQIPVQFWCDIIGEKNIAYVILDRLIHQSQ